jgi:cytochrome c oxidase cbb3-type subunit I/II
MLWAPSWGGMLNGLLTLRGAWHKVRTDPVLKFFAAGVTFYGMATFEGPMLAIKSVNALAHYTDWIIGHVHSGTLGWNGFMAAGMFYYLAPRLWNRKLHSVAAANMHFWIGLVGILLYIASMWISGITQGLMLSATKDNVLVYPNFIDAVIATKAMMYTRAFGGTLYLGGWLMLVWNIWKTAHGAQPVNGTVEVFVEEEKPSMGLIGGFFNVPVVACTCLVICITAWAALNGIASGIALLLAVMTVMAAMMHKEFKGQTWGEWYERLLENSLPFTALTILAVLVGGMVEIIPTVIINQADNMEGVRQIPYTPLELAGRDIYVREGCYLCHSQMIRTLVGDVLRYGDYSKLGESIYDHPFQWGSKRIGPDLAREGGKNLNIWHFNHMRNPRDVTPGSIMPNYPWLYTDNTAVEILPRKLEVMRELGVPYPKATAEEIQSSVESQEKGIVDDLKKYSATIEPDKEIVAVIAYLQKIGKSEKVPSKEPKTASLNAGPSR